MTARTIRDARRRQREHALAIVRENSYNARPRCIELQDTASNGEGHGKAAIVYDLQLLLGFIGIEGNGCEANRACGQLKRAETFGLQPTQQICEQQRSRKLQTRRGPFIGSKPITAERARSALPGCVQSPRDPSVGARNRNAARRRSRISQQWAGRNSFAMKPGALAVVSVYHRFSVAFVCVDTYGNGRLYRAEAGSKALPS